MQLHPRLDDFSTGYATGQNQVVWTRLVADLDTPVSLMLKLTEARWGRFVRALAEFEGWLARLRVDYGAAAADFVITHRIVEGDAASLADLDKAIVASVDNGYALSILGTADETIEVKVV